MSDSETSDNKITLTRQELYWRVWETPMAVLAPSLWISDVGLRKKCVSMGIPVPPRGWWAKKSAGHHVRQTALPALGRRGELVKTVAEFYRPVFVEPADDEESKPVADQIQYEDQLENKVTVPPELNDPHPLVAKTLARFRRGRTGSRGELVPDSGACLNVSVTPATFDRAMRILHALLTALDYRGYTTTIDTSVSAEPTVVSVGIERVSLRLEEKFKRSERPPVKRKPGEPAPVWEHREYDYNPTGILRLTIRQADTGYHAYGWSDHKRSPLEDSLNGVIVTVVRVADEIAAERRKSEERERERVILEEQYRLASIKREEEAGRVRAFDDVVARWQRSKQLRKYLDEVHAIVEDNPELKEHAALKEWMDWAEAYVDRVDPLATGIEIPRDPGAPRRVW